MTHFSKNIKTISKNLLARKGRSFLTILGIVIGVAGVIIIISLGAGAQALVLGQVNKLGTDLIGISPGKSNETGPPTAVFGVQVKTLVKYDMDSIKDRNRVPYAEEVSAVVQGTISANFGKESADTNFVATDASYPKVQNIEIKKGTFISEEEERSGANVIVLGSDVEEQLFPDGNSLGSVVKLKREGDEKTGISAVNIPFRVIGVLDKQGMVGFRNRDDQVFIPFKIGQKQILGIDYIQFMSVKVDKTENVKSTITEIQKILRENHKIQKASDDDFSVRDLADAIKFLTNITDGLRMFLSLMAAISLVVGGIGIMNIMLVTVSERTREIGLRKSLGATSKQIRNQFLLESILLTSLGGIVGIILGVIISYLISIGAKYAGYDWAFIISFSSVFLAVSVSMMTGIIFGLFPAMKAARLNPIEALRYE